MAVMATSGMLSIFAVASPVTMLVAPGPEVVSTTPVLLFVGGQNMLDFVAVLVERVVGIERRAAGIAEYGVNALLQ